MVCTMKTSFSCLPEDLRPVAVQGQPKSPACPKVSLGQEGSVWRDRGVHMFCTDIPEGYLRLMLQLQGNRNLEHERYRETSPLDCRKNEEALNQESLFSYWKKLLQRQHLSSRWRFPSWWRVLIFQTLGFVEYVTDFQKEIMINSTLLARGVRQGWRVGISPWHAVCFWAAVGIFVFKNEGLIFPT